NFGQLKALNSHHKEVPLAQIIEAPCQLSRWRVQFPSGQSLLASPHGLVEIVYKRQVALLFQKLLDYFNNQFARILHQALALLPTFTAYPIGGWTTNHALSTWIG